MQMYDEPHRMLCTSPYDGAILGELIVRTHREEDCLGPRCAIHNPSDHPLNQAKMVMRADKQMLIERLCEHGVGHPDPDSVDFIVNTLGYDSSIAVHGCDGCCGTAKNDER